MAGTLDHCLSDIQKLHRTVQSLEQNRVGHVASQVSCLQRGLSSLCYLLLSEQGIERALCSEGEESAHPSYCLIVTMHTYLYFLSKRVSSLRVRES